MSRRHIKLGEKKDISTVLLGITVAAILWLTVLSRETLIGTPVIYHPFHSFSAFLKELQRGRIGNSFGNILLFIPVGFLVPIVTSWKKLWKTAAVGLAFSLFIEITQLITARGCFDIDDVILNGLGTIIGYGIYSAVSKYFHKTA